MAQPADPHDAYELGRRHERDRMAQRCANRLGATGYEWDSAESTAFAAGVEEGEAGERQRIIARLATAADEFDAVGLPRPARWCQSTIEALTNERRDTRADAMTRWALAEADTPAGQTPAIPGAWRAITAVTADTQTGLTIAELSPADGEPGHALLTQHDGLETRTDMHVRVAEPELSGHPGPEYDQDSGTAGHLRCCQPEPEA